MNDLLDADVLIHVVDVSGESDSAGNIGGKGDPMKTLYGFTELHMWIYFNVIHKWHAILRRPEKFVDMFAGYHATPDFIYEALRRCGIDNLDTETICGWTPLDLHKIIAHFIELRFPIFLCLNKVDKLDARSSAMHENIRNVAAEFSKARFHPACAKDGLGVKSCIEKAMQLRLPIWCSSQRFSIRIMQCMVWLAKADLAIACHLSMVRLSRTCTRIYVGKMLFLVNLYAQKL